MTPDDHVRGDRLAQDLQVTMDFIAEYFPGDPPRWFDQHLEDIKAWWAGRRT